MKKQFISHLFGLFSASAIISSSFAQTTVMHQQVISDPKSNFDYALVTTGNTPPATNALPLDAVSTKAQRSFEKSFKGITDQKWYTLDKKSYLATFTSKDGRNSRAAFAKNGYMYYSINFGNEKSLPKEERRIIKSNYVDYTIGNVSEVNGSEQKVWIVNLQDDDNLIIARVADRSLDELAHYQTHLTEKKHKKGKIVIPQ